MAYLATPSTRFIAIVMALGAGLLIGSVAFELIDEALKTTEVLRVGLFTLVGAATFTLGNWWLARRGGGERKDSEGSQASRFGPRDRVWFRSRWDTRVVRAWTHGAARRGERGIVGGDSAEQSARRDGVFQRAPYRRLDSRSRGAHVASCYRGGGRECRSGIRTAWSGNRHAGAFAQGFAAGALIAMVADTLLPEAYEVEGFQTGPLVAIGFAVSLILSAI